ncbi:MAG: DUF2202 domain-containing protein [Planctomycetaceae bacterium]
MKNLLMSFSCLLALMLCAADVTAQGGRGGHGKQGRNVQSSQSVGRGPQHGGPGGQNSGAVVSNVGGLNLLKMWEEEKLARDVYMQLAKTSGLPVFQNISRSEGQHMQALERLLSGGGTASVSLNKTPGVFTVPEYQQLYATLVAAGSRSPLDALMVGAKIEEMDIADLNRLLSQAPGPQVGQVLAHLLQGSHNHLRAFASQIASQGATYKAQFLTQAEFNTIAKSTDPGHGAGAGGRGPGSGGSGNSAQGVGGRNAKQKGRGRS